MRNALTVLLVIAMSPEVMFGQAHSNDSNGTSGQVLELFDPKPSDGIISCFPLRNELAEFPGGTDSLRAYLNRSFVRPEFAGSDTLDGTIRVQFSVNTDGTTRDIRTMKGLHPTFDKEAERVIGIMPKWKPARLEGKAVATKFVQPFAVKAQ